MNQQSQEALVGDINFLLLGLYGWEYVQSLDVEYAVICGRSSFRVPLIPYIVGRTSLLFYFIMSAIESSPFPTPPLMCIPGILFIILSGAVTMGCASSIFMIRTWVIWKDSHLVHVLQVLLALGQCTLLVLDVTGLKVSFTNGVCMVIRDSTENAPSIIYTMCYDFITFVLSVVGLARQRSESPLKRRLRTQGVFYFAVAGIAYIPAVVFVMRDTAYLGVIFANIALAASIIVSTRAVRSLLSLDTGTSSGTRESNMALTTQIVVGTSMTQESTLGV